MSMTSKFHVACDYSGVVQGADQFANCLPLSLWDRLGILDMSNFVGKKATVLATQSSEVDKGAFLAEFSQFPGEEEWYSPLTF